MCSMKRYSTLLIIREMQIRTTMKYHLTLLRMTIIKKSINNKCWRECGEKESVSQFSLVTQLCSTLCDPMEGSTPGFPVHHQLPELTQTLVYRVGDAIRPSHPLSPHSSPAFNLSQQQGLFQWVSSSHQVAKVKGILLHYWWECQLVQPLWKTVWSFLKKLKIELPYNPAIQYVSIYLGKLKTQIWKETCTPVFIAALFGITKTRKQPKCPSIDEWINKVWYISVCMCIYVHTHTQFFKP